MTELDKLVGSSARQPAGRRNAWSDRFKPGRRRTSPPDSPGASRIGGSGLSGQALVL